MKMEDNDVNLFFKNKDKKKKRAKQNNVINPATLLQQHAIDSEIKKNKKSSDKNQKMHNLDDLQKSEYLRKTKEDEEWEEAECEADIVDFSKLRIGVLQTENFENQDNNVEANTKVTNNEIINNEDDSDSEAKKEDQTGDNPWSIKKVAIVPEPKVEETVSEPEPPVKSDEKYTPPYLRSGDAANKPLKSKKAAPNITNSMEFPSLGEAMVVEKTVIEDESCGKWTRVNKTTSTTAPNVSVAPLMQHSHLPKPESQKVSSVSALPSNSSAASSSTQPTKYIPPHLRKQQQENRFSQLKEKNI